MKKRLSRRRVLYLAAGTVFFACLLGLAAIAVLTFSSDKMEHGAMISIASLCAIGTLSGGIVSDITDKML